VLRWHLLVGEGGWRVLKEILLLRLLLISKVILLDHAIQLVLLDGVHVKIVLVVLLRCGRLSLNLI
jgi:hypothetical protein